MVIMTVSIVLLCRLLITGLTDIILPKKKKKKMITFVLDCRLELVTAYWVMSSYIMPQGIAIKASFQRWGDTCHTVGGSRCRTSGLTRAAYCSCRRCWRSVGVFTCWPSRLACVAATCLVVVLLWPCFAHRRAVLIIAQTTWQSRCCCCVLLPQPFGLFHGLPVVSYSALFIISYDITSS